MIYYVEDDANIRELVIYTLTQSGFEAKGFEDADAFYAAVKKRIPKLVLLDIMLPGEDGISILKNLRKGDDTAAVPVIMLTAKGSEYDKVMGLDMGADDYLAKPFGMMELVSRVKAILRRSEHTVKKVYVAGNVELDATAHIVYVDGERISLTLKEFELLHLLMKNKGRAFSRDDILEKVWGYSYEGGTRTVDVHVQTLRQKLGSGAGVVATVRGVGYRSE